MIDSYIFGEDDIMKEFMLTCDICGHSMNSNQCKILCPNCGYMMDCSDTTINFPEKNKHERHNINYNST